MKFYLKEELFGISNAQQFWFHLNGKESKKVKCSIKNAMEWYYCNNNSVLFSATTKKGDEIFIDGTPGVWVAAYLKLPYTDCKVIIAMHGKPPFEYPPLKNVHGEDKISPEYTF